ncbi:MAG TPA: hypothetical protein VKB80_08800 [Kofleriaceae bacterium]|nr:hypothetical protein [Kofleriaceae bacterium]
MSDLQCPATILLFAPESVAAGGAQAILEARHLSGVFVASAVAADPSGGAAAAMLADERAWRLSTLPDVADGASLARAIDDLADLHRGETIAVVGSRDMIQDMLGDDSAGPDPITIAVDSSGWVVSRGGRRA